MCNYTTELAEGIYFISGFLKIIYEVYASFVIHNVMSCCVQFIMIGVGRGPMLMATVFLFYHMTQIAVK